MRIKKSTFRIILVSLFSTILIPLFLYFLIPHLPVYKDLPATIDGKSDEISLIKIAKDSKNQVALYTKLINRVGPVPAQEELLRSGLPFDGQTHLLNHTVGDWLYKKHGSKGLIYCKDYFLSSCYHGLIIPFIAKEGIKSLDKLMNECWKVSNATAGQCAHGIGHGLLAWENYANLPVALKDCDTVAGTSKNFPLFNCYDGAFMENNWAIHNDGKPAPERWIDENDPTFPCFDSRIDEQYRKACWSNQPQVMYKLFRGDVKKVSDECLKLENKDYQVTCFDAIARQIHPLTHGNVSEVFRLCRDVATEWQTSCVMSNMSAYFSVGDREIPFQICSLLSPEVNKRECYFALQFRFAAYSNSSTEIDKWCSKIPLIYQNATCTT